MATITVTLVKDCWIAGVKQTAGSSVTVERSLAGELITNGIAAKPSNWESSVSGGSEVFAEVNATGGIEFSVGGGAERIAPEIAKSGLMRLVVVGDSMTAANASNGSVTSITRSNNVATVVCTTHGRGTGEICTIYNCTDDTFNLRDVTVTRVDANNLTYPCPGPDGSAASISATRTMTLQSASSIGDNGYMFWLQSKCGGALKMVRNFGRNGCNSAEMLADYDNAVVEAPYHDMVIIFTGYNDWANANFSAATVYSNVVEMVKKSCGKLVVVVSSIPYTTNGTYGSANRGEAIKYNRAIRNFCNTMRNVRFADAAKYMIDATHATKFSPLANMLQADGIHPSPKCSEAAIARAIYEVIQYDVPRVSRKVSCSGDNYGADSTNPNILDAAPWTTSGGALAGGATGTAAAGIAVTNTGSGTVVASVVARSDGLGYDQQVVFTPAANNDSVTFSGAGYITGRTSDGQKLSYLGELTLTGMSGANIKSIEVYIVMNGANATHYLAKSQASGASTYPNSDMTIDLASLVDPVICAGHTGIGWNVVIKAGAAGTALTAKLGRQSLEKV